MRNPSDSTNLEMNTLREMGGVDQEVPSVRVLTILCHPDPGRVGERARLDGLARGYSVSVSRAEPLFASPSGGESRPLIDPYLSRRPLEIATESDGRLTLTPPQADAADLEINGRPLVAPLTIADDSGAVLQLSRRVVLLLHREPLERQPQADLGLLGESHGLELVRRRLLDVAPSTTSVLIRGESGTGKELVARAIHAHSARRTGPFVAVNMGALTPALAMSELFGHVRGAFTDARDSKLGLFAKTDGGTLFLDEVGQASAEVQAALLRVLETREIPTVGSDRSRWVDVRILSATDSNLELAIVEGRFSEALFHRLAAYEIRLPPLRERVDDAARLLVHFLRESLTELGSIQRMEQPRAGVAPWLPAPLMARLARYPWPGNVRELRNAATQIALSSHRDPRAHIGDELERKIALSEGSRPGIAPGRPNGREPTETLRPSQISGEHLLTALQSHDWNLVQVACELGISRTSLYALIEKYGVGKRVEVPTDEILRCREECGGDLDLMTRQLRVSKRALVSWLTQIDRG